jgi:hypothetical protein
MTSLGLLREVFIERLTRTAERANTASAEDV